MSIGAKVKDEWSFSSTEMGFWGCQKVTGYLRCLSSLKRGFQKSHIFHGRVQT